MGLAEALHRESLNGQRGNSLRWGEIEEQADYRSVDPESGSGDRFDAVATSVQQPFEGVNARVVLPTLDPSDGRLGDAGQSGESTL
jgi:hypothetical protein